jgi:hypothetical protein
VKARQFILMCVVLIFFVNGCTTKQITQVIYDSVKSNECMKTQGKTLCNPDEQ